VSKTIVALDNSQPETTSNATDINPNRFSRGAAMKASLYPDSTVGFGNWQILLSTAQTRTCVKPQDGRKALKIIIKKSSLSLNNHLGRMLTSWIGSFPMVIFGFIQSSLQANVKSRLASEN